MATVNPQLGVDLKLEGGGGNWLAGDKSDLVVSDRGDLATVDDLDNVRQALIRRLNTTKGDLWAHPDYGNDVWALVSEPIDDNFKAQALANIKDCIAQEPRVKLLEVTAAETPVSRMVDFTIRYQILSDTRVDNLIWTIDTERVMNSV